MDELPEFARRALEALRQPLEEGRVWVTSFGVGSARESSESVRERVIVARDDRQNASCWTV
jgi:predicted ATPase with chaperone activity